MTDLTIAPGGSASVYVLHDGYVGRAGDDGRVAGTVTLIIDGDAVIVVDPGMVASRDALLAALVEHGPDPSEVTDVVFSHHHPDHTVNAALFPAAASAASGSSGGPNAPHHACVHTSTSPGVDATVEMTWSVCPGVRSSRTDGPS